MHILHVVSPAPVGGLETVVANLTSGLSEAGVRVTLAAVLARGEQPPRAFGNLGSVEVVSVLGQTRRPDREFKTISSLLQDADLIHTHGYRPDIVQGSARTSAHTVSTVHGFTGGQGLLRFYELLQVRALRDYSRVVAVSPPLAQDLEARGVSRSRIETIPNAVRPPQFFDRAAARSTLGIDSGGFAFGWVGRMTHEKNPGLAVRAFSKALPSMKNAQLVMIGDGPLRSSLEKPTPPEVRFVGAIPEAGRYMKGLDALVLSSDTEGTPVVLIEAMWGGVPIVTTAVGGIPWLLSAKEARLVEKGSADRLAQALIETVQDSGGTSRRADNAAKRVSRDGDFEAWIRSYAHLYEGLAKVRTDA